MVEITIDNLEELREKAKEHIISNYDMDMPYLDLFPYIWEASCDILPHLEVQVVFDSNDHIHVSTGSSGYVDFQINPVGMKLPIKCWIHTHPFGSAYFSGVDWKTVNTWQPLMVEAYVLGGVNHWGHWTQNEPNLLAIKYNDNTWEVQTQNRGEEE